VAAMAVPHASAPHTCRQCMATFIYPLEHALHPYTFPGRAKQAKCFDSAYPCACVCWSSLLSLSVFVARCFHRRVLCAHVVYVCDGWTSVMLVMLAVTSEKTKGLAVDYVPSGYRCIFDKVDGISIHHPAGSSVRRWSCPVRPFPLRPLSVSLLSHSSYHTILLQCAFRPAAPPAVFLTLIALSLASCVPQCVVSAP